MAHFSGHRCTSVHQPEESSKASPPVQSINSQEGEDYRAAVSFAESNGRKNSLHGETLL